VGVDSGLPSLQGWIIGRGRLQAIAAGQQTATLELMQRSDKVHACPTLHNLINSSDLLPQECPLAKLGWKSTPW